MAKPRIFLSSTCYDLSDARARLTEFLEGWGFEVLNSQNNSFGVKPKSHSHDACLAMMENADYVVLIIGGRRGGTYIGSEQSITNEEIKAAQNLERPIIAFLDRKVDVLRQTHRRNPNGDFTPVVHDNRVFDFIDYVSSGYQDNWLHLFDDVTDIEEALKSQFAYYLLLYSQGLRKRAAKKPPARGQVVAFPSALEGVPGGSDEERTLTRAGLREVYDSLKQLLGSDVKDGAKQEQMKAIWVVSRHGHANDRYIEVGEDRFKASAWARSKGQRVFSQMTDCGIRGEFDVDEDSNGRGFGTVRIIFDGNRNENMPAEALKIWIEALVERYGAEDALNMFLRLDMRLFSEATKSNSATGKRKMAGAL